MVAAYGNAVTFHQLQTSASIECSPGGYDGELCVDQRSAVAVLQFCQQYRFLAKQGISVDSLQADRRACAI